MQHISVWVVVCSVVSNDFVPLAVNFGLILDDEVCDGAFFEDVINVCTD